MDDRTLTTRWGKIGGKEQTTSHTYDAINVGKRNELSPADAALADYFRKRTKKEREGYNRVSKIVEEEEISVSWIKAYENYKKKKPELSLY